MTIDIFQAHRKKMMGIAYRMLGSKSDAEDILQDVYIRWHENFSSEIKSGEAWLTTVTTRLCIDRLRSLKGERQRYIGPWLPEPVDISEIETPSLNRPDCWIEQMGDLSVAFITMLEKLSVEERAALILRESLDLDYSDIAILLEKSEASCRQLVHRAKDRVRQQARFRPSQDAVKIILSQFIKAAEKGDKESLIDLIAANAQYISDGGGKVQVVLRPLDGNKRIADLFDIVYRKHSDKIIRKIGMMNGHPAILTFWEGCFFSVMHAEIKDGKIDRFYNIANPDKLSEFKWDMAD